MNVVEHLDRSATVIITRAEVEERSGMGGGPTVCVVEIVDGFNGLRGRFWVSAEIKNGKPVLRVSTQNSVRDIVRRSFGFFRSYGG